MAVGSLTSRFSIERDFRISGIMELENSGIRFFIDLVPPRTTLKWP